MARSRFVVLLAFAAIGLSGWAWRSGQAAALPPQDGPEPSGEVVVISAEEFAVGLGSVTDLDFAADGQIYVSNRLGRVYLVASDGTVQLDPFLDIYDRLSFAGEGGFVSLALHPDFLSNGYFFVNYTDLLGNTRIARFHHLGGGDFGDEVTILYLEQPSVIHNGADVRFGPDGYLYIALGDGGDLGDPNNNGQNGQSLLGAILRLDVDGALPYTIPADNPYVGDPQVLDEIWAMGLRNPWRFSFDRDSGDMYIGDVGEREFEEINLIPAATSGQNFGWRCYQGHEPYLSEGCPPAEEFEMPVYDYFHFTGSDSCNAIVGGYVYRGSQYPEIAGHYIFADYCRDLIWGLVEDGNGNWRIQSVGRLPYAWMITFGQGTDDELYLAGINGLFRISAETVPVYPEVYLPLVTDSQ